MTFQTFQLADAASPSVSARPEGVSPGLLRASNVATRVSSLAEGARARHGMPSLPAGCEVRAGTYTYPDNCIEDGNHPAGSSYFTYQGVGV